MVYSPFKIPRKGLAEKTKRRYTPRQPSNLRPDLTTAQIAELTHRLQLVGLQDVSEQRIEYALRSKSTNGDVNEAFKLLMVFEDSVAGVLNDYDPKIKMLGAENREKTTCYLDALLFALFAREDVFEPVLLNSFEDEPRRRLVLVLRLWVNMLRSGRLITTDIVCFLDPLTSHSS